MVNTEKEDRARAELVKLAADNDMYFVIWWGHFGNYFVGVKNSGVGNQRYTKPCMSRFTI